MDDHSSSSTNRRWWNRLWKITPSTACALCKCSWESVGHAIFRCERAKSVWNKLHFNVYIPNIGNIKGFDIYSHLAAAHNDTDLELITCLMWCIWSERNKEIHGSSGVSTAKTRPKWHPPDAGCFKLNVDAACNNAGAVIGFGALIRDHYGNVLAGLLKPFQGCFSPKEMEAVTLFHSVQWALHHQLPINIIETDDLVVV
uniref:RNase H type-1 domain-containing protein n=1 Tax=Cannabis sativa TaxID=3483 RepID=A0A803NRX6_CANSA